MTAGFYLDTYLSALAPWLTRDDVTDLLINQPGEVWIETIGRHADPHHRAAGDGSGAGTVLRARSPPPPTRASIASSPFCRPPCPTAAGCRSSPRPPPATGMAIAIRKHVIADLSVDDLAGMGLFAEAQPGGRRTSRTTSWRRCSNAATRPAS